MSSLDVTLCTQLSAENFTAVLRQIPGEKDLILESWLLKRLDKFAAMPLLNKCGVKKVFKLEQILSQQGRFSIKYAKTDLGMATNF